VSEEIAMRRLWFALAFSLPLTVAAQQPAPRVEATGSEVVITNTRGHDFALLGVTLTPGRLLETRAVVVPDSDRDGRAAFAPEGAISRRGIWVAVDLDNGAYAIGGNRDYEIRRADFPFAMTKKDAEGTIVALEQERPELLLLVVRPGRGAWTLRAWEGAENDDDKQHNGRLLLSFANAAAVGPDMGNAPRNLKRGDVIAAIDTLRLEVFAAVIE
jgi:hypothetical protein